MLKVEFPLWDGLRGDNVAMDVTLYRIRHSNFHIMCMQSMHVILIFDVIGGHGGRIWHQSACRSSLCGVKWGFHKRITYPEMAVGRMRRCHRYFAKRCKRLGTKQSPIWARAGGEERFPHNSNLKYSGTGGSEIEKMGLARYKWGSSWWELVPS